MLNRWGGWFVLISLALATTWLVRSFEDDLSMQTESNHHVSDYMLKNFKSTQMDDQGRLKNQLIADTMVHYPDSNATLTAPYMVFYEEAQPMWTVRAEHGEVSPEGNEVWLLGNTTLEQHTQDQQKTMEIISRDVWVRLDTEYAQTSAPTTIISNNGETHCVGMRLFMSTEQVELLSQVRGQYVLP
jgi:lipopolysaccharide export system protein LptC